MSRALLSALLLVLRSRPGEHSSRLPTPSRPSYFRNSPRQIQQGLPKRCHPPAWQRHGRCLSKRERGEGVSLGISYLPLFLLPHPASHSGTERDVERWKASSSPSLGSTQWVSILVCLSVMALDLCSLGARVSLCFEDFRGHCSFTGVFISQGLARGPVNTC